MKEAKHKRTHSISLHLHEVLEQERQTCVEDMTVVASVGASLARGEGLFCGDGTVRRDRNEVYTGTCNCQNSSNRTLKICVSHGIYFIFSKKI